MYDLSMEERQKPNYQIKRSQKSWRDYAQYITSEDVELKKAQALLRERKHQVGQATQTSYRIINHWDQKGLIPIGLEREGSGWRKFNLIEVVWIRMINRLRAFGLSLEQIVRVKTCVMDLGWEAEFDTYLMMEYFFLRALGSKDDPYLVVWPDNTADLATAQEIELSKIGSEPKDMLLISIKSIVKEMGLHPAESDPMFSLNNAEIELLDKIRSEDNKTVKARLQNRAIKEIETKKVYPEGSALQEIIASIKNEEGFATILSRHSKGKRRSVEVKKQYRMK